MSDLVGNPEDRFSHEAQLVYDYLHLNPFWIENQRRDNEIGVEDEDHYNILLIGIDSVSKSRALRNRPKSHHANKSV